MDTSMTASPHSPPFDEASLVQAAARDADAFAELYRRYLRPVYRYHLVHTADVKDAEDLTSQTFLAALEGIHTFRGDGPFAAWLMGIATRKRAMFYRGRHPAAPLDESAPDRGLPTDQAAMQHIQLQSVSRALHAISPDRAEAILLTVFAGLTHREAGALLKRSEAAVKMLVSRGLHELRQRTSLSLEVE